jgi:hypothetical protein
MEQRYVLRRRQPRTCVGAHIAAVILVSLASVVPASAQAGSLSVQLVERGYLPVPTTAIQLVPVANCSASARRTGPGVVKTTDKTGYATFPVPGKGHYRFEVTKHGGFAAKRMCIELFDFDPTFPTAYVQLRLAFSGAPVVVR